MSARVIREKEGVCIIMLWQEFLVIVEGNYLMSRVEFVLGPGPRPKYLKVST